MRTMSRGGVATMVLAFGLAALLGLPEAGAQCTSSCNADYCDFDCPTSSDYLILGSIYAQATPGGSYLWQGWGVCRFASDGSWSKGVFQDIEATSTSTVDYRLRADGASASAGGNDVVRYAATSGEYCVVPDGDTEGIVIYGTLGSGDTYLFWGDKGNDYIYICDRSNPGTGNCINNAGRADGRDGTDHVYGSPTGEYLWGGNDGDYVYGYAGNDTLDGGPGNDTVEGGDGNDVIHGDTGNDTLKGDAGVDSMFGDGGNDTMSGGTGDDYTMEGGDDDDILYGEAGCDLKLHGGGGSNWCICESTSGSYTGNASTGCTYPTNCSQDCPP